MTGQVKVNTYFLESLSQVIFKVTVSDYLLWIGINQIITILTDLNKLNIYFYV